MVKVLSQPCGQCGWPYPGYHVCVLDFSTAEGFRLATKVETYIAGKRVSGEPSVVKARSSSTSRPLSEGLSDEHRTNIANGVRSARARDPKRIERNAEILRLYDREELTMNEIVRRTGVAFKTVSNVLHTAAAEGDLVIRRGAGGRPRRAVG